MRCLLLFLLLSTALPLAAKKDRAPLPKEIIEAKTVFIDNQSQHANVADAAYKELRKWKRFNIVMKREEADLILLFTYGSEKRSQTATGRVAGSTVDVDVSSPEICQITLSVQVKEQPAIWSNTKRCSWAGATTNLMRDFKDRIDNN